MTCEHCEQLQREVSWLHDEIEGLESRLNLLKRLSETPTPTVFERIDQIARAINRVVMIGRNGFKENTWFAAEASGTEVEAPTPAEAIESLIGILKRTATADRLAAQKKIDAASKLESL